MVTAPNVKSSTLDSALGPTFEGTRERNAFIWIIHISSSWRGVRTRAQTHIHKRRRFVENVESAWRYSNLDSFRQESENLSHHVILGTIVGKCYCTNHDRWQNWSHHESWMHQNTWTWKMCIEICLQFVTFAQCSFTFHLWHRISNWNSRSKRSLYYLLTRPDNWHHKLKQFWTMNCWLVQIVCDCERNV